MTDTADVSRRSWFLASDELFISADGWLRFPRPRPQAADLADQELPPFDTPLDCPGTAFAPLQDQVIDPQLLWSWKPYTSGDFSVHMGAGDHCYGDHHLEEFVQAVVGYLEARGVQTV